MMLGKVLCCDLLCCTADFEFVCPLSLPPSPSPSPRAVHGIVFFCNALDALDCIALRRNELHCAASLLRQVVSGVPFCWLSGCVMSYHLALWYVACHKQTCFVDVSGTKLG